MTVASVAQPIVCGLLMLLEPRVLLNKIQMSNTNSQDDMSIGHVWVVISEGS